MLKVEEIIIPESFAVLSVFNPGKIEKTKKAVDDFNKKTMAFLASVEKIKKDFNFKNGEV